MSKGTILIVQADQSGSELLREHFEGGDYKVLSTHDTQEALALTRSELPRSIIIDLDTPNLDASALMSKIRDRPRTRHIHVTLLTQRSDRSDKLGGLTAGADEFMNKPVDIEELGLRVRNALRRAAFDNLTNPTTGLPGPRLIQDELRHILRRQDEDWALLRISIRHFGPFNDMYGFLAGEEVLRFTAQLIGQTTDRLGTAADFVGHSGGDDFIIVTMTEVAPKLSEELIAKFDDSIRSHYSIRERERGSLAIPQPDGTEKQVPLMALNVSKVSAADGPFSDIRELTQAVG
ncbi:MAG: response regulator [Thermoflexales bacterium]|nr:response regulator [Thermoflexales bacterium]